MHEIKSKIMCLGVESSNNMRMRKIFFVLLIFMTPLFFILEKSLASDGGNKISIALSQIKIENENRVNKYLRSDYKHWVDADVDGCDTRREVLVRDSNLSIENCFSNDGEWYSIYDGIKITDARKIDIDHVVALAEAHRSGAWRWDIDKKKKFANDLDSPWSLRPVSSVSNRYKSDKDASKYKPTHGLCEYTYSVIITKWRWSLSIDAVEKRSLVNNLKRCEDISFNVDKITK
jgi:hypothetical protein